MVGTGHGAGSVSATVWLASVVGAQSLRFGVFDVGDTVAKGVVAVARQVACGVLGVRQAAALS